MIVLNKFYLSPITLKKIRYIKILQKMTSQKPPSYLSPQNPTLSQPYKQDQNNSSSSAGYQYVAGLKHIGYVIGDPINNKKIIGDSNISLNMDASQRIVNGLYVRQGGDGRRSGLSQKINDQGGERNRVQSGVTSRNNSRIQYSPAPGVIVHEYPSRPARSPSPISVNPNANIIPAANFIYNSPGGSSTPQSRTITYSPARFPISQQPTTFSKPPPFPTTIIPNPAMVPLAQYQRCVSQCRLWEQKYNELYTLYTKNQNQYKIHKNSATNLNTNINTNITSTEQYNFVIKQNKKLKERVKDLERNQEKMVNNMEDIITRLVNKYRDSTIKESMLLLDRYRLEKKIGEKM